MIRVSVCFILLAMALACGGGSTSETQPERISLKIDMVYPTEPLQQNSGSVRQKFAVLDAKSPFRIGTDIEEFIASPPGDPKHATHARARFFQSGNFITQAISPIIRYSTDPSSIDPNSRKIEVRGVPTGVPLYLSLELGKNFGEIDLPYAETIYYSANVNHILISGSNLIVNGSYENSIKAQLRPAVSNKFYQLQCYVDFSKMPIIKSLEIDKKASTIVNVNPLKGTATISAPKPELISDNVYNFQAFFFEISEIPLDQINLDVTVEFGANLNLLSGGMILPDEALAGLPLLFDFETTYVRTLTMLHEKDDKSLRASGNFMGVYKEISKAFARADNLMNAGNSTQPVEIQAQDLALMQVGYEMAKLCSNNTEANRFRFTRIDKFQSEVMALMKANALTAIDYFLFSGNKSVPLKVNFDTSSGNTAPLYILGSVSGNNRVDSSGHFISAQNNNLGSANFLLGTLVTERIVNPYYETEKIWDHIESFTKLASITSDNVNK